MGRKKKFNETAVVDKALALFWEKGYESTSTQELLEAMELNSGSMYKAFGNKRSLFIQVLHRYYEKIFKSVLDILDNEPSGKRAIEQFFQTIKNFVNDQNAPGCLFVNSSVEFSFDHELKQIIDNGLKDIEIGIQGALKRAKQSGELNTKLSAESLAKLYLTIVVGLQIFGRNNPPTESIDDVVSTALSLLT